MKNLNFGHLAIVRSNVLALALLFLLPAAAYAQDANLKSAVDRLERLERDIRTLNAHLSRGGQGAVKLSSEAAGSAGAAVNGPAAARVGLRIDRLEQDLRSTTGVLEEINHRVLQVGDRLDKLVSDIDFRLSSLEARGAQPGQGQTSTSFGQVSAAPSRLGVSPIAPVSGSDAPTTLGTVSVSAVKQIQNQNPALSAPVQPAVPVQTAAAPATVGALPAGTPQEQYTYAFNLLQQTNYDQAEVALNSFIETNGDDPLADNARYWLGETYYIRKQYQEAAQMFYDGYQKNPSGAKASGSLLKLGMSLAGLDKKDDACAAFAKVLSDFPKLKSNLKKTVLRENKRNGC